MLWGLGLACLVWACGSDDDDDDADGGLNDAAPETQTDATANADAATQASDASGDAADAEVKPELLEVQLPPDGLFVYKLSDETWEDLSFAVLTTTYDQAFKEWMLNKGYYWMSSTIRPTVASFYESCEQSGDESIRAQAEAKLLEVIPATYLEQAGKTGKLEELSLLISSCGVRQQ
jgi:hypothetical protein